MREAFERQLAATLGAAPTPTKSRDQCSLCQASGRPTSGSALFDQKTTAVSDPP